MDDKKSRQSKSDKSASTADLILPVPVPTSGSDAESCNNAKASSDPGVEDIP